MSHMRKNLPLPADWQGPSSTGLWQIGYYLDAKKDISIRLIQGLKPSALWLFDWYSALQHEMLPYQAVMFINQLPLELQNLISKVTFPGLNNRKEGYFEIEEKDIKILIEAAVLWHTKNNV